DSERSFHVVADCGNRPLPDLPLQNTHDWTDVFRAHRIIAKANLEPPFPGAGTGVQGQRIEPAWNPCGQPKVRWTSRSVASGLRISGPDGANPAPDRS